MKSYKGVVGLSLLLTAMAAIGLPASAAQLKAKTAVAAHAARFPLTRARRNSREPRNALSIP